MGIHLAHHTIFDHVVLFLIIKYIDKILNGVSQEFLFLHGPRFHCHTKGWVLQVCRIGES